MKKGKLITIEGIEGAGKSTVMQYVQQLLQAHDIDVVLTREPGGTEIAEEIRNVLLHTAANEKMQPDTELLLMFAGRVQHIQTFIFPNLQAGKWVLSDRYIDASYAYQGAGRGLGKDRIAALDKLFVGDLYPDLTLLLDLPVAVGFERTKKRSPDRDRIEQEKFDFFERVRSAYLERAEQAPERMTVIDASQNIEAVQSQISKVINDFCK